jgi:hypothetical protein
LRARRFFAQAIIGTGLEADLPRRDEYGSGLFRGLKQLRLRNWPGSGAVNWQRSRPLRSARQRARHLHDWFARDVGAELHTRLAAGAYGTLWLLAGAPFLGEVKAALGDHVAARLRLRFRPT